jgi:hypothetical protein
MHKLSPEDLGVIRAGPTLKLPLPDTHCWDDDENIDVWSYSHEAMLKYASQVSEAQRKVLEQALTALETCTQGPTSWTRILDFDADLVSAAMDEIERILK